MRNLLFLVCIIVLSACAHTRTGEAPTAARGQDAKLGRVENDARPLFTQAEKLFNEKKYEDAIEAYRVVKGKFPNGKAAVLSSYRIGTAHYYRGDYQAASREFESFLAKHSNSELAFDAIYNRAAAEYQMGAYEQAYQLLSQLKLADIQAQGPRRAEVVYQLTAQAAGAMNHNPAAVAAYSYQLQLPISDKMRSEVQADLDYHLERIKSTTDLERLSEELKEPWSLAKVRGKLAMTRGTAAVVPTPVTKLQPTVISKPIDPAMEEASIGTGFATRSADRFHIGVVLPLTGKYAAYGKKALDGILLAANQFKNAGTGVDVKLSIEDSASSPVIAAQAVDKLVNEDRVIGIIGPLQGKEATAVASNAQKAGVANLSLSTKEGISEKGTYLFQNALTPSVQIANLVEYAVKNREMKRFAILSPDDSFGKDMTRQFWQAVERHGGIVVGFEAYPPDETDFQKYVQSLVLLNDSKYRRLESTKLADFTKEMKEKTGKEPKLQLPPITDFDALFIPDTSKNVAQIAASLSFYEVEGVTLLGTTDWNGDQLYKRAGKLVEGAAFPGGLSLSSARNTKQQQFVQEYVEAFGSAPDLLSAQAYEAMQIMSTAATRGGNDRDSLVMALTNLRDWESALGQISFDEKRLARRKLPIYLVGAGGEILEN